MPWYNFLFRKSRNLTTLAQDLKNPCNAALCASNAKTDNIVYPMTLSAFFGGVNLISNSLAIMKWNFKDKDDQLLPQTHYLWHLFDESELTRFNLVKNLIKDLVIWGNAFCYIERDKQTAKPKTLHYSPASKTRLYYNDYYDEVYYWNTLYSNYWDNGENYLHFYMASINGFSGIPINKYAYQSIQLSGNTEKMVDDYYKSNGTPHGVVTPNQMTPMVGLQDDNLRDLKRSWEEAMSLRNGSGTVFVPADIKYTQLSSNAKDAALIESRLYNVSEVARWLNISPTLLGENISPTLLGDLSHNAYGTISESQKEFIIHTLSPYVVMLEEELTRKLIMPSRQGREYVDLDENSVLATDQEKQANYYKTLTSAGIMSINEARHQLGLPAKNGADELIIPFTDLSANTIGKQEEENTDTQPIENE